MEYQEKIIDILKAPMRVSRSGNSLQLAEEREALYEKLLSCYKLGNQKQFDQTVSDHMAKLLYKFESVDALESGKLYGKSYITKNEADELDGIVETYWPNGNLKEKVLFKSNQLNGDYYSWYENGQLALKCCYITGKLNGVWTAWYPNGNLKTKKTFTNGLSSGYFEEYMENGILENSGLYR